MNPVYIRTYMCAGVRFDVTVVDWRGPIASKARRRKRGLRVPGSVPRRSGHSLRVINASWFPDNIDTNYGGN